MISNIWNRNGGSDHFMTNEDSENNRDCPLCTTQVDQSRKNDKSGAVMKDITQK